MARMVLCLALFASSLPLSHLCTASPVLPEEGESKELLSQIQQCRSITDDNLMYHCVTRERKRLEIKQELSTALAVRPAARKNFSIPEHQLKKMLLKEGFAEDGSFEIEKDETTTTRIVPVTQDPPFLPTNRVRSFFNFKPFEISEAKEAVLFFFIKGLSSDDGFVRYNVHIYRFRTDNEVDVDPIWSYKRMREMPLKGDWDSVEVTDLVKDWGRHPESNFGMMVKVEPEGNQYSEDYDSVDRSTNETAMFLEIKMNPEPQSRARRSLSPIASGANLTCGVAPDHPDATCCRYQLEVDFTDFGWDWIIAPKRYNAFYCAGKCTIGQHQKHSQHAFFMEHRNAHKMCCSPEKLSEMKIIYMDDSGNLQIRMISNMIVQKCGCS